MSNCSAISWQEQITFDEMIMMSTLYKTIALSLIFIVLAHWNNNRWVDMPHHSDTLFWFWANQSLLLLLKAVCLCEEAAHTNFSLWFDPTNVRTHKSTTFEVSHVYHYTTNAVHKIIYLPSSVAERKDILTKRVRNTAFVLEIVKKKWQLLYPSFF